MEEERESRSVAGKNNQSSIATSTIVEGQRISFLFHKIRALVWYSVDVSVLCIEHFQGFCECRGSY